MTRYEQLAGRVQELVGAGTLRPGDRLPSVRRMSRQQAVSVSTVLAAYRLLEARGVVEARPQSGFYVRDACCVRLAAPAKSDPSPRPRVPRVWEVAQQLAADARARDVVPLGNADPWPDLLPLAALRRRMRALGGADTRRALAYGDPRGELELRTAIARRMLLAGCSLRADELLITNGAFEAVHLALRAVCAPGDAVAVESPVHFLLLQMLQVLGLKVVEVATDPTHGIDLEALGPLLAQRRVAACLVNPVFQNPLGSLMPPERLRRLVELCRASRTPLIEDDVYGELHGGPDRPSVAKAFDQDGWVLHCSSFSKSLCPGLRVGWLAPGRFDEAVRRAKVATNFVTATPPQLALAAFLRDGAFSRHVRRASAVYATNRLRCRETIARSFPPGTAVSDPRGGLVLWVELPAPIDAFVLCERALAAGISLAPGHVFSAQGRFERFVRIACAKPWDEEVAGAVSRIGALAHELLGAGARGGRAGRRVRGAR